jgi:hypothetical protein
MLLLPLLLPPLLLPLQRLGRSVAAHFCSVLQTGTRRSSSLLSWAPSCQANATA